MVYKKSLYAVLISALLLACLTPLQSAQALDNQIKSDIKLEVNPNIITKLYLPGSNGVERWGFETGGEINLSSPAIGADGTVYIGSLDGKLYAADKKGKKKWEFATEDKVYSSPTIGADGTVYIGSGHNLYAIAPDGMLKWRFEAGGAVYSTAAIGADGTVYFECEDGKLYALNPDGTKRWEFATGGPMSYKPAIDSNGTIYVGSRDKKLYAIKPNGTKKWELTTVNEVKTSPAIGTDGTIYIASGAESLYAIKPDGTKKWEYKLDNRLYGGTVYSSPTIGADGTIYVGAGGSGIYAIMPDGTKKWKFEPGTGGILIATPTVGADGAIYVGSADSKLYAIKPDGTKKWEFKTNGQIVAAAAVGPDGAVYIGSGDHKLYAIGMVYVNGVNLNKTVLKLEAGQSETLQATVAPGDASYQEIAWSSSNDRIAKVDVTGKVTGIAPGTATITATSEEGGYYKQCVVTVTGVGVNGIKLDPPTIVLKTGEIGKLTAAISPSDATNKQVMWSSDNQQVADVDSSGQVTGKSTGTATITAKTEDGGFTAVSVVRVSETNNVKELPAQDIALSDIDGHWAKDAIMQAVSTGFVRGYPDRTFKPDRQITRAEFAVMLMNALKPSANGVKLTFKDKGTIGSWAAKEIMQCVELNIIHGYPDGTFRPNKTISHAEMIHMVVLAGKLPTADGAATGYLDNADIPKFARSNAAAAEMYGIASYITDNKFKPNEPSTRAEAVTAIINMLKVKM
ncbi:PQQ-binding-like beta-propeller repeat protein [Paenibacillus sp. GCM10027626]|uniref:S-layer homology domain-containing protein n=1 Tax=Paenibacillus sp. GCM10027626 TaxID=3273411 RepID=UPI003625C140